ncbi:heavy-metal-associated domain-containing protein [Adhaeribacter rhizoryzae]|uniref:Heavy-metal-associated domain-containing protein n=1 Tax=Adhaeribacter rhizoryzae TaxID=2607907 RepID=A0A5M6DP18_9BACT|nr:heavy-metal-associated domain-containing protein [Adhaeribacter rhizoryzae]KAA5549234.1 heavy-metal-associated domain-containing protein [Adhaeribacter rhizoryzae]
MKTLKFKTNINCGGCIANAKPYLDSVENVQEWHVDTNNPDKILTVKGEAVSAEKVIENVKKAGYKIEEKKSLLGGLFG